jgi:hypothetical protein
MKKILLLTAVGFIVAGLSVVQAGAACCGMGAKTGVQADMKTAAGGCPAMAGMDLTAEQKTKVDEIWAKCQSAGCTQESQDQMMKDLEGVLSPEQLATCKSKMESMGKDMPKGHCPMAKPAEAPAVAPAK